MNKNNEKTNKILEIEKSCYDYFICLNTNFNYMQTNAEKIFSNRDKFLTHVYHYIEKNINKPLYVEILDKLSILNTNEEIESYLLNINIDLNYLKNNILNYFMFYRPHIYYLDKNKYLELKDKLTSYENYLYRKEDPLKTSIKINNEYAYNIINSFINSKYSMHRFCFNKNIASKNFKRYVFLVKNNYNKLYQKYIETINFKEKEQETEIKNDVLKILKFIKENNNTSLIDFCLITKYDILELIKVSDNILSLEDIKLFRKVLKPLKEIRPFNESQIALLYRTKFTFNIDNNLIQINNDDKYTVINYLQENDTPICNETFKDACIRYYKNLLDNKNRML